jgi:cysteine synthase B
MEGPDGAIREVVRLYEQYPERYFYADQYSNPANPQAHYETTGPEVIAQTQGRITHLVAGTGTSGTIMGAGRRLREYDPTIQLVAVEPSDGMQMIEGLKHMATSIIPAIYDMSFPDRKMYVDAEEARDVAQWLARVEGMFVGLSAGAAVAASVRLAREIGRGEIVAICPDSGNRYLTTRLWE